MANGNPNESMFRLWFKQLGAGFKPWLLVNSMMLWDLEANMDFHLALNACPREPMRCTVLQVH